jgi:SnoaL-like protein
MTEATHELAADNDAGALLAIESIKQLKARYCRYLDTKDWTAWRTIFSDDFVSDTSEAGGRLIAGANDFVAFTRKGIGRPAQATAHQVHAPEIELMSATTARGVWALQDVVRFGPGVSLVGYGHYHETYEKVAGQWLIKSSKLTRLREDIVTPVFSIYISDRIRQTIGKIAGRLMGPD